MVSTGNLDLLISRETQVFCIFGFPKSVSEDSPVSAGFQRPETKVQSRDKRPESGGTLFALVRLKQ